MILVPRHLRAHAWRRRLGRLHAPALEILRRQRRRPRYRKSARHRRQPSICPTRYSTEHRPAIDQLLKSLRLAIGKQSRRRLVGRPLAGDHVGRHRPWRAAKADQRRFAASAPSPAAPSRRSAPALCRSISRAFRDSAAASAAARAAALRPRRTGPCGRARTARPECRKTGSPHRSRSAASAATSLPPPIPD